MRGRILVVDDEAAIRDLVRLNLETEGFEVTTAPDVASALTALNGQPFALAILDIMLPDGDGVDLARKLREQSDIPIVMLSAKDTDVDKAVGLGVGADDYVTKPFSPIELIARVKAHLRRYNGERVVNGGEVIEACGMLMDVARHRVTVDGREIALTAKEFDILRMLAEHPGCVYTKAQIYEHVWNEEPFGDLGTIMVHIRRLRTKVEEDPDEPKRLTTVWGIGYRFEEAG